MDPTSITPSFLELLSRITNRHVRAEEVNSSVAFIAAMITVMLGVIHVDKTVTDAEKKQLQVILNELAPVGNKIRPWMQQLLHGIQEQKIYSNLTDFITLTSSLSESQKLLLISLSYKLAAIDNHVHLKEKSYLMTMARQLKINPDLLEVLDAGFCYHQFCTQESLDQFKRLLDPVNFEFLDPLLMESAEQILAQIPAEPLLGNQVYSLEVKTAAVKLKKMVESMLLEFNQLEKFIESKPKIAELSGSEIWLKMGECSGYYVQIQEQIFLIKSQTVEQGKTTWLLWVKEQETGLKEKWIIASKLGTERTEDATKMAELYAQTFSEFLQAEIGAWVNQLVNCNLGVIDDKLMLLENNLTNFGKVLGYEFGAEVLVKIHQELAPPGTPLENLTAELHKNFSAGFNVGEFAADIAGSVVGVFGGIAGAFFKNNSTQEQASIEQRVFEQGWKNLSQSHKKLWERLEETITEMVEERCNRAIQITEAAIKAYQELLAIQTRYQKEAPDQQLIDQIFIKEKREQLIKLKRELEM